MDPLGIEISLGVTWGPVVEPLYQAIVFHTKVRVPSSKDIFMIYSTLMQFSLPYNFDIGATFTHLLLLVLLRGGMNIPQILEKAGFPTTVWHDLISS